MRFGVCTGIDKAPQLADAGFDYIEVSVQGELVPHEGEDVWKEKRARLEKLPLPPETFYLFMRNPLVGPEVDEAVVRAYVDNTLARAAQVGGEIVVFGSGGFRRVPEGFPRERAVRQIESFLNVCADASDRTGVVVVVEPLNTKDCNIINSVTEGSEYVRRVNRPGVRCLADTWHMEVDNEPLASIVTNADVLAHAHTADSERRAPGTGSYDHVALFRAFREAGYDRRLSVECNWKEFDREVGPALERLKSAMAAA